MISPRSRTQSTKQTSEQNITRDTEIKNKLTVTRWEVGGDNGEKGEGLSGTRIKDPWTKPEGVGLRERGGYGWGGGEWWGENGDHCT